MSIKFVTFQNLYPYSGLSLLEAACHAIKGRTDRRPQPFKAGFELSRCLQSHNPPIFLFLVGPGKAQAS